MNLPRNVHLIILIELIESFIRHEVANHLLLGRSQIKFITLICPCIEGSVVLLQLLLLVEVVLVVEAIKSLVVVLGALLRHDAAADLFASLSISVINLEIAASRSLITIVLGVDIECRS